MGRIMRHKAHMGESARRQHLEVPNTHNGVRWRRKERMLRGESHVEFLAHESSKEGTHRLGDAVIANEATETARARRKPSKLLELLTKQRKRVQAERTSRFRKRADREMLKRKRRQEREASKAPVADVVVPQKSAPPAPSLWNRIKGVFGRKAVA